MFGEGVMSGAGRDDNNNVHLDSTLLCQDDPGGALQRWMAEKKDRAIKHIMYRTKVKGQRISALTKQYNIKIKLHDI